MMSFINDIYDSNEITKEEFKVFLILLNPFAPHITEEIFERLGFEKQIANEKWPSYDKIKCLDLTVEIVIQINGKVKSKVVVEKDLKKEDLIKIYKNDQKIKSLLTEQKPTKTIVVPNKPVNYVVPPE